MNYSIGIVTYVKRYEKYFKPLIQQIKNFRPDIEIIVCINGEHKNSFNEDYKESILSYVSSYPNIFPVVHPQFRSLSKLWNTCLINSTNDLLLLLNDDITITDQAFFNNIENIIKSSQDSFKINGSWSHTLLNRRQVDEIGWFDERFLGVGEEDGDFEWRWENKLKKPFKNIFLPYIINHVEQADCLQNIKKANGKYSEFNFNFSHNKYQDSNNGFNYGIMSRKVICVDNTPLYYQSEKFFWDNKDKL